MKLIKYSLISLALAGAAASAPSMAATGTVHFKGEIVKSSCDVTSDTNNQTVDLGRWPSSQFQQSGDTTPAKAFTLKFENCDSGNYTVRFDGNNPSGHPDLLAVTGGATGVGIKITDESGNVYPISEESPTSGLSVISAGSDKTATANLKAQYESYADTVGAGDANADATFAIQYR
ncbi:Type-1 fimbrial protein, A chain [Halomonadaceae bacterium LMG 33818]|uniref:fimbrial protein n=1 Tax=Cernens ardua TaxID=3402176 RepID=UPI003EDC4FE6